jgi:hypothetical protein
MSLLGVLRDRNLLVVTDPALPGPVDEVKWQDMHLAAADLHLRRRLAAGEPVELPVRPSRADTVLGLLISDCGPYHLAGIPEVAHTDPRLDVFVFSADIIKAGPEPPADPEAFLQSLQDQADRVSEGLAALGVPDEDRSRYRGLQPLIWGCRAVLHQGPKSVGRSTVDEAVMQLVERFFSGGVATAGAGGPVLVES